MMSEIKFNEKISSIPREFFCLLNNHNGENTATASNKSLEDNSGTK